MRYDESVVHIYMIHIEIFCVLFPYFHVLFFIFDFVFVCEGSLVPAGRVCVRVCVARNPAADWWAASRQAASKMEIING